MKTISKALVGTVAAGAMAMASAAPAVARDRDHHDGIGAGEIIAGAVILGGIAAIAASAGKDRSDYRYGDRYDRDGYDRGGYGYDRGNGRYAVEQCIAAVQQDTRRAGYRYAQVTEIRNVDYSRYGFRVEGRIVVDGNRGWGRYNRDYNRYDRYDRYGGYDNRYDRDAGSFTCDIQRGRVVDLDYRGIRGLR